MEDKNENFKLLNSKDILKFILGSVTLVSAVLLFYWFLRENFFPTMDQNLSHGIILSLVVGVFGLAQVIFFRYLDRDIDGRISVHQSQKVTSLETYLTKVELRLQTLKAENNLLKEKSEGMEKNIPDGKLGLITHERVFMHELSNKIQIVNMAIENLLEEIEAAGPGKNEMHLRKLQMANKNLEAMTKLISENRDYLIIAS